MLGIYGSGCPAKMESNDPTNSFRTHFEAFTLQRVSTKEGSREGGGECCFAPVPLENINNKQDKKTIMLHKRESSLIL